MTTQHSSNVDTGAVYRGQPEDILVVPRTVLAEHDLLTQGFSQSETARNVTLIENLIRTHGQFAPRDRMEIDEDYKQIIPYFIFAYDDKLFLMQRSGKANETRLASKYTLGIGGHVRQRDLQEGDIAQWGKREFAEEVYYDGNLSITPLGVLNDDSNAVGRVHIGVVYLLRGDSPNISIRSELQGGELLTLAQCAQKHESMETWSALVFNQLSDATSQ